MANINFDFGFTLVDEDELTVSKELSKELKSVDNEVTALENKVDELYNAIAPLLNNLKANPEKEYILWPNRSQKVEEFEEYLRKIYSK